MVTETELNAAIQAGAQFKQAIVDIKYRMDDDLVVFVTPWGIFMIPRQDIPMLKELPSEALNRLYVSQTGLHHDELDLDISGAGLLEALFRRILNELPRSY